MRVITVLLFLVNTIGFGQTSTSPEEDSLLVDGINKHLLRYTFQITALTYSNDSTYKTSRCTGFKLENVDGIYTSFHGVVNSDVIEVKDDFSNQIFNAEIILTDNENDVALLKPIEKIGKNYTPFKKENGLKWKPIKNLPLKKGFSASITALWNIESNLYNYNIEIPEYKYIIPVEDFKIGLINRGANPVTLDAIYQNTKPVIFSKTALSEGHSGAPLYYIDSNEVYVLGIAHGSYPEEKYNASYFISLESITLKPYIKGSKAYQRWNIENEMIYTQTQYKQEKQPLFLIKKIAYTQDSLRGRSKITRFNLLFNFDEKLFNHLKSDTLPSEKSWSIIMQKEQRRHTRKRKKSDIILRTLQMLDSLVYTDEGLVNTICAPIDSSIYDDISFTLLDMAINEEKFGLEESETFYKSYLYKIIYEIQGMREIYTRASKTLDEANIFDRSLFEMRRELYTAKSAFIDKSEHIRHSYSTETSPKAINDVIIKYDSLRDEFTKKILTINELINEELGKAKEFIDSLSQKESPQKLIAVINEIHTNPNHEHIAILMEEQLRSQQYFAKEKLKKINQLNQKPKIDEIIAIINSTYRSLYNEHFMENIEYQPFIQMESKVVNGSIQMQFQQGSEIFNSENNSTYQTSIFSYYPKGSSKNSKSVQGAKLTAQLLGEFLSAVRQKLYSELGVQNYYTDVHVIGMSDGFKFKGAYNPKKDYSKEELRDFKRNANFNCTVISDINCSEHGLELIDNSSNVIRKYKDLEHLNGSYNNNIKLAYHRALNYWNVIEKNLVKDINVVPHIYACNVPEKGGICRRTEVGVTFKDFPAQKKIKSDLTNAEKFDVISAFEVAIK